MPSSRTTSFNVNHNYVNTKISVYKCLINIIYVKNEDDCLNIPWREIPEQYQYKHTSAASE